jgi:NADPH:quinone reductase-like Zn-dependent oxidoreductase
MKAIILKENGDTNKLIISELPQPEITDNEVLVKVKAISINPVDAAVRQNKQALIKMMKLVREEDLYVLGWDISGTVVKTGKNTSEFEGKDVFGMINFPGQGRAYAEYVAAPAEQIAVKPSNITHEEAAGATLAALTAWQALVTYGKIGKGDKVLIHAAAGGVGHFAVQIAKHFGAYVIGTASAHNRDFVISLGADEFIEYKNERFESKVKDADLILDSINDREHLGRSIKACRQGGKLISIKYYFDDELQAMANERKLYTNRILVSSDGHDMKSIAALLEKGIVRSYITATFPFTSLPDAHKQIETGKTRGKIVVTTDKR